MTNPAGTVVANFVDLVTAQAAMTTTAGCWSVKARYTLNGAFGNQPDKAASAVAACGVTAVVNGVVFPALVSPGNATNTCAAA